MASLNSIYERLGSVRVTETQRREAETALMWVEVIADLILRTASEIRRTVARVTQGIGKLIDGPSRSPARPRRRDSETLARKPGYDACRMYENVKRFLIASVAALSSTGLYAMVKPSLKSCTSRRPSTSTNAHARSERRVRET